MNDIIPTMTVVIIMIAINIIMLIITNMLLFITMTMIRDSDDGNRDKVPLGPPHC